MTGLKMLLIVLTACAMASCKAPKIAISGCIADCSTDTKTCLDYIDTRVAQCTNNVNQCELMALHDAGVCLTTAMDCVSVCAAELESTTE